ncbi:hypothetical protein INT45_010285 [Circinella minor]|uniref:ATP-dependent DNA helicase n=1 Tax=Circinella minor TaxID=1195481 RepID=A0A8H7RVG7_9FUNG|nr:hypothetical protein INT45_010285 [Circinella minor]
MSVLGSLHLEPSRFQSVPSIEPSQLFSVQFWFFEAVERSEYISEEQTQIYKSLFPTLNNNQRHAFNTIMRAIDEPDNHTQSHIFFVNGPGGTGKSLLFKTLLSRVRSQDHIALPVASSGIAAILLPGGHTADSRFKVPIDADKTTTCNLPLGGAHAVDKALRDIMGATDSALANIPFEWLINITNITALIDAIYPTIREPNPQPEHFSNRAILASINADIDEINNCAFELFPGDTKQYLSTDHIIDADDPDVAAASYPTEYLQSLTSGGIPSYALNLKVGMPLILLRNLNPDAGLCNRTKVFVTALLDHTIVVKRIDISHDGKEHYIPRINMCTTEGEHPFILCHRQFPVRLAFAMTIHKSQGQSLTHIGICLQEPVFVHGQLYVALS